MPQAAQQPATAYDHDQGPFRGDFAWDPFRSGIEPGLAVSPGAWADVLPGACTVRDRAFGHGQHRRDAVGVSDVEEHAF